METELLKVSGMTCGGCIRKVTKALQAISGVGDVNVSLSAGEVTVQFDERMTALDKLKLAVTDAGYVVNGTNAAHSDQSKGGCCGLIRTDFLALQAGEAITMGKKKQV